MTSGTVSTARSTEHTSTRPVEKGGGSAGNRSFSRGADDESPPRCRWLGLPVVFVVTGGQRHDSQPAQALIVAASPKCLLADKAYDSNQIRELLSHLEAVACIPPKANRKVKSAFDKEVYKARNAVECAFNLLKQARRFATRYEKTLRNYVSVVAIGCALLWLRI